MGVNSEISFDDSKESSSDEQEEKSIIIRKSKKINKQVKRTKKKPFIAFENDEGPFSPQSKIVIKQEKTSSAQFSTSRIRNKIKATFVKYEHSQSSVGENNNKNFLPPKP